MIHLILVLSVFIPLSSEASVQLKAVASPVDIDDIPPVSGGNNLTDISGVVSFFYESFLFRSLGTAKCHNKYVETNQSRAFKHATHLPNQTYLSIKHYNLNQVIHYRQVQEQTCHHLWEQPGPAHQLVLASQLKRRTSVVTSQEIVVIMMIATNRYYTKNKFIVCTIWLVTTYRLSKRIDLKFLVLTM